MQDAVLRWLTSLPDEYMPAAVGKLIQRRKKEIAGLWCLTCGNYVESCQCKREARRD